MSEHTKEPWKVAEDGEFIAVVDDSDFTVLPDMRISQCAADFRRIVACVNACAGFANPEKDIPAIETASKMHFDQAMANGQRASEYEAQRDELLAALKDMIDYFQYTDESEGQYESVQRAKAAIAKVE